MTDALGFAGRSAANTALIELDRVSWTYGSDDQPAPSGSRSELRQLTLSVRSGEVIALCGPSGSGKSSVLKLINGLIPHFYDGHQEGTVRVAGLRVDETPVEDLGLRTATVFQNPRTQFFTGVVSSEIAFALENAGIPPAEIRRRVTRAAAELHLDHLLDRRLETLSGGQQQQVACAVTRAIDPDIYLLDEPTSNLSTEAIARIAAMISNCKAEGRTVIIAEHRLAFLAEAADRIVVIGAGSIGAQYSAAELWAMPSDRRRTLGFRALASPVPSTPPLPDRASMSDARPSGLHLRNIRCSYHRRRILDIDDLSFPAGAVTAITGENGSGKTTLARAICGLHRCRGEFILGGRPLTRKQRLRSSYIVMQDVTRQLFTESVRAEVELGLDPDVEPRRVDDHLAALDLLDVADRHPLSLSGGQKQRLVVATARATRRSVYVFDEPTSGVDLHHLESISAVLRGLADDNAVVVVITHDHELIDAVADQVLDLPKATR